MRDENPCDIGRPVPGADPHHRAERGDPRAAHVERDGMSWPLGTAADVEWITSATETTTMITSAIPPVFEAYATIELPEGRAEQTQHERALLSVLQAHAAERPWWLGYLDTGADDVVFPDAPRLYLYADWPYVLVRAGAEQAARWRSWELGSFWSGRLPNLMFPADRSWLVSTLWDDDWTCVGGTAAVVDALAGEPALRPRVRRVALGEDATPPGHEAI